MKKRIIQYLLALILCPLGAASCHYLDVDPELGLADEEIFSTYKNFWNYFSYTYDSDGGQNKQSIHNVFPFYYDLFQYYRLSWQSTTDASDCGALSVTQLNFKQCNLNQDIIEKLTFDKGRADNKPICASCFGMIRKCNVTIEHIDECRNITEQQYNDLLGQAYFLRGYSHYGLCRLFGGMPYIDHTIGADDEWDLPRLSRHETYVRATEDMLKGAEYLEKAGYMRRDGRPGEPNHLQGSTLIQPNGVVAYALAARSLLFAASPLNNELGNEDWIKAAEACAEALDIALEWGYEMVPFENYADNYLNKAATNESLWTYTISAANNAANNRSFLAYPQSGNVYAGGNCPTQNFVDKYETIWGDALNTEADRAAAVALGHYNDQDPYANRDPRFEFNILHDGSTSQQVTGQVNIYFDPETGIYPGTTISGQNNVEFGIEWGTRDNSQQSYSNTGYYCKKYWNGIYGTKDVSHVFADPQVRVAELYLNYAEAVNEAYGPDGTAPGHSLTAVEAVNLVRARVGMPPVQSKYTTSKDAFRERIRNERCVELSYEGNHYYFDIRRWKIAPETMSQKLYGMHITKVPVSEQYPNGRKYERRLLPDNRQSRWKDCMYFFPFPDSEARKLKNFVNNDPWR
ncbi:MAG: RagB/SusD family nutrient uptake outer membrane protein [Bacteroidales bacterium]|nr:RagB/SusD family nutrient uptake outer membrane protein [Bacteroidales bacterium]